LVFSAYFCDKIFHVRQWLDTAGKLVFVIFCYDNPMPSSSNFSLENSLKAWEKVVFDRTCDLYSGHKAGVDPDLFNQYLRRRKIVSRFHAKCSKHFSLASHRSCSSDQRFIAVTRSNTIRNDIFKSRLNAGRSHAKNIKLFGVKTMVQDNLS